MRLVAFLLLGASSALAQEAKWDAASTEACLMHTGNDARCFGLSATICIETGGNYTSLGMADCISAEHDYWAERMNAVFSVFVKADPMLAEDLQTMQSAWEQMRDAKCVIASAKYLDESFASIARTQCHMKETARHALYLETSLQER